MTDQIKSVINALIDSDPPRTALPAIEPVGGYPAQRGSAVWQGGAPSSGGGGGGIASPLTETDAATREYWESSYLLSVDFLIGYELKPLKQINMTDAAGAPVVMRYAEPSS